MTVETRVTGFKNWRDRFSANTLPVSGTPYVGGTGGNGRVLAQPWGSDVTWDAAASPRAILSADLLEIEGLSDTSCVRSTVAHSSGRHAWEIRCEARAYVGICTPGANMGRTIGSSSWFDGAATVLLPPDGTAYSVASNSSSSLRVSRLPIPLGTVVGIVLDLDKDALEYYLNGAPIRKISIRKDTYYAFWGCVNAGADSAIRSGRTNFGANPFGYLY